MFKNLVLILTIVCLYSCLYYTSTGDTNNIVLTGVLTIINYLTYLAEVREDKK